MLTRTIPQAHIELQKSIAADVEAFLSKGGKIKVAESHESSGVAPRASDFQINGRASTGNKSKPNKVKG